MSTPNPEDIESEDEDAKIEFIEALKGQSKELAAAGEAAKQSRLKEKSEAGGGGEGGGGVDASGSSSSSSSSGSGGGGGSASSASSASSGDGVPEGGAVPKGPVDPSVGGLSKREQKHHALEVAMGKAPVGAAEELDKSHKFWSTQPVPRMAERVVEHGPLEPLRTPGEVAGQPLELHPMFEWCDIDVNDEAQLGEMYSLLCNNYVEDDDSMFRFAYPQPFLKWSLTPPHYRKEWHVGVRLAGGKKPLMACITGVPAQLEVYGRARKVCEINFLCVDKRLRSKRLAPRLIKEVTRRVNVCGVWQAVYTAGVVLPKPVASSRYWHRSIDPKKLVEVGFSRLPPRMTMSRTQAHYRLPPSKATGNLRPMEPKDVPSATLALNAYLARFALRPLLHTEEVAHWLLPREAVVDCFVLSKWVTRGEARRECQAKVAAMVAKREQWLKDHPVASPAAAEAAAAGGRSSSGGSSTGSGSGSSSSGSSSSSSSSSGGGSSSTSEGGSSGSNSGSGSGSGGGVIEDTGAGVDPDWEALVRGIVGEGKDDDDVEVVTDLVSFYHLPSTVIGSARHSFLYAAYLYYYVSEDVPLKQLLEDCMVLARDAKIDVLNCLDLAENNLPYGGGKGGVGAGKGLLEELKFGIGDGNLQYYLFNWACPQCEPKNVGLVLH